MASGLRGSQAATGGNGQQSTSLAVHRRVARPAAIGFSPLPVPVSGMLVIPLYLPIEQARRHLPLPHLPPALRSLDPVPKMSGEGVEIGSEAVAGEEGQAERRPTARAACG